MLLLKISTNDAIMYTSQVISLNNLLAQEMSEACYKDYKSFQELKDVKFPLLSI